jgi:hypothetical protein
VATTDNDVVTRTVRACERNSWRLVALGAASALLTWVYVSTPGPARLAAVIGAILLFLAAVRARPAATGADAELLAIVHDRIAAIEEGAGCALRQTADELSSLRQRIEPGS